MTALETRVKVVRWHRNGTRSSYTWNQAKAGSRSMPKTWVKRNIPKPSALGSKTECSGALHFSSLTSTTRPLSSVSFIAWAQGRVNTGPSSLAGGRSARPSRVKLSSSGKNGAYVDQDEMVLVAEDPRMNSLTLIATWPRLAEGELDPSCSSASRIVIGMCVLSCGGHVVRQRPEYNIDMSRDILNWFNSNLLSFTRSLVTERIQLLNLACNKLF
ncbi:hypothetical protein ACRALDRAFT_211511 [Sodiomyces alcalophilus JCM 7366]|uniref:uncharacterized protein n=1 Tax=Sodiomyces alcalophilus JCM 7366 TaxID=591952 RepID=UPI0039B3995F